QPLQSSSPTLPNLNEDDNLKPLHDTEGAFIVSRNVYEEQLKSIRKKETLRNACTELGISAPKSANLERLRRALADYWFNKFPESNPPSKSIPSSSALLNAREENPGPPSNHQREISQDLPVASVDELLIIEPYAIDEGSLIAQYGVTGAAAEELLAYDDDEDGDSDGLDIDETELFLGATSDDESENEYYIEEGVTTTGPSAGESFTDYQKRIRVEETQRAEQNRRAGGIKTQKSMIKAWQEFCAQALQQGQIKDEIIDEHHILLYIRFCSERPKRDRRGRDIPNTFIGASQIKKLYFGALRIRKEQEANDPTLATTRPVTSIRVWDSVKGRMNEALQRVRDGLVPSEDAPDIVANTFLSTITEEQMNDVRKGFLMHRELRSVINGHLCWNAQHASGNRGDDFRALRLAELQPFNFLHPNKETSVPCVLGLQGEEKAGASRGMRTKVNPVYTVFIAHEDPTQCPLGAFAFYHHYIHDVVNIAKALKIDWSLNKSWRAIRVLHSKKSLSTPYHEQSLYNLYVQAFKKAKFPSKIKVHLPRHMLGYQQEKMGVDASITSRMGWTRGETFYDTYAPALPKEAILGAHGFKTHEPYDPVWRRVHVPDQFLHLVCPMAEEIHDSIVNRQNLNGAANYWKMVIDLRPYLFQSGAAIYQLVPESPLFRLPALANTDVQNWMKHEFPNQLALLKASAGDPISTERIQNAELQRILQRQGAQLVAQTEELARLRALLEKVYHRTDVLTPTKAFDIERYNSRFKATASSGVPLFALPMSEPVTPPRGRYRELDNGNNDQDAGIYEVQEGDGSTGLRAFVNASPNASPQSRTDYAEPTDNICGPRERTQVDLVLPPAAAFTDPGGPQLFWPPVLGQKCITWNQIYPLIRQPKLLWDRWRPERTLNQYTLDEIWACWTTGEPVFDSSSNVQTGVKPPLREIESHFTSKMGAGTGWRSGLPEKDRKFWQRFREIPEYIDSSSASRSISPLAVIQELKDLQATDVKLKGCAALAEYVKSLRENNAKTNLKPQILMDQTPAEGAEQSDSLSGEAPKKRKRPITIRRNTASRKKPHL
ncbi:hypothetical protein CVT24_012739, partial [Panaeolus cyanescens]